MQIPHKPGRDIIRVMHTPVIIVKSPISHILQSTFVERSSRPPPCRCPRPHIVLRIGWLKRHTSTLLSSSSVCPQIYPYTGETTAKDMFNDLASLLGQCARRGHHETEHLILARVSFYASAARFHSISLATRSLTLDHSLHCQSTWTHRIKLLPVLTSS